MKIAIINTYAHGGAGTAAIRTTEALRSIGHDAKLLVREGHSTEIIKAFPNKRIAKIPFIAERLTFLPFEHDKSVRFSFSPANFGLDLRCNSLVQQSDAIHLHWINQGFLGLKNIEQLTKMNKPVVWTLHDMWAFTGGCHYSRECNHFETGCGNCFFLKKPAPNDLSYKVLHKKIEHFSNKIKFTTPSEWLAKIARTSFLLKNADIQAIPNPIDTSFFKPISKSEVLQERNKLGIPVGSKVLLFVAMNISEIRKGFVFLKLALQKLKENNPNSKIELLVLGKCDTKVLESLPFPSTALGLVNNSREMRKYYAVADAFVIPSLEDNLPNTVMESMSCGTPVIGFETGGIPEMVDHQVNGFIAQQKDIEGLAKGIFEVMEKEENLDKMRGSARKKVVANYSYSIVAGNYEKLYR